MNLILQAIKAMIRKCESRLAQNVSELSQNVDAVQKMAKSAYSNAAEAKLAAKEAESASDAKFLYNSSSYICNTSTLGIGEKHVMTGTEAHRYKLKHSGTDKSVDMDTLCSVITGKNARSIRVDIILTNNDVCICSCVHMTNVSCIADGTYNYKLFGTVAADGKLFTLSVVCENSTVTYTITRIV